MLALFGLSKVKLIIMIAAAAAVATFVGILWLQNASLRSSNSTLISDNAGLTSAVEWQRNAITQAVGNAQEWQDAHEALQKRIEELSRVQQFANAENRRLRGIFADHDLAALAAAEPGLIENIINAGSNDAFSVLRDITSGDYQFIPGPGTAIGNSGGAQSSTD